MSLACPSQGRRRLLAPVHGDHARTAPVAQLPGVRCTAEWHVARTAQKGRGSRPGPSLPFDRSRRASARGARAIALAIRLCAPATSLMAQRLTRLLRWSAPPDWPMGVSVMPGRCRAIEQSGLGTLQRLLGSARAVRVQVALRHPQFLRGGLSMPGALRPGRRGAMVERVSLGAMLLAWFGRRLRQPDAGAMARHHAAGPCWCW